MFRNVYGTRKDNYLTGYSPNITYRGNDLKLWGYQGDDKIFGDWGNDWIDGGGGWDYALFSDSDNTVNLNKRGWQKTGDGRDKLVSIEGVDGGGGNDWLIAHNKYDSDLIGGAGRDWLTAGKNGQDHLWGGAGIDTFELKKGRGMATIMDHEWKDWIYIKAPARSISYNTRFGDMQIYQGNDLLAEVGGAGNKDLWHDGGKYWYIE